MSLFSPSHLFVIFHKGLNWDLLILVSTFHIFSVSGLNSSVFQCEVLFTPLFGSGGLRCSGTFAIKWVWLNRAYVMLRVSDADRIISYGTELTAERAHVIWIVYKTTVLLFMLNSPRLLFWHSHIWTDGRVCSSGEITNSILVTLF